MPCNLLPGLQLACNLRMATGFNSTKMPVSVSICVPASNSVRSAVLYYVQYNGFRFPFVFVSVARGKYPE